MEDYTEIANNKHFIHLIKQKLGGRDEFWVSEALHVLGMWLRRIKIKGNMMSIEAYERTDWPLGPCRAWILLQNDKPAEEFNCCNVGHCEDAQIKIIPSDGIEQYRMVGVSLDRIIGGSKREQEIVKARCESRLAFMKLLEKDEK